MELTTDLRELLDLFAAHKVRFVIVGGYALAHPSAPGYTGDLEALGEQP